jgi:hypothetical protein
MAGSANAGPTGPSSLGRLPPPDDGSAALKRAVIFVIGVIAAYAVGHFIGSCDADASRRDRDLKHWQQLAELDRAFLTNVVTRPGALVTGRFVIETCFPGIPPRSHPLDLVFSNGLCSLPMPAGPHRNGMADTFVQNGNVVSWHHEGILYEGSAECVGVIDGEMIWGRIYGWSPGDGSIGLWRIYRQPSDRAGVTGAP